MIEGNKKPRVVDDQTIREVYANKLVNASFDSGAIVVTMGTTRFIPDRIDDAPRPGSHPTVHVTTRFAMSPAAAVELINTLNNVLTAAGVVVAQTAAGPRMSPAPAAGKAN